MLATWNQVSLNAVCVNEFLRKAKSLPQKE